MKSALFSARPRWWRAGPAGVLGRAGGGGPAPAQLRERGAGGGRRGGPLSSLCTTYKNGSPGVGIERRPPRRHFFSAARARRQLGRQPRRLQRQKLQRPQPRAGRSSRRKPREEVVQQREEPVGRLARAGEIVHHLARVAGVRA